MQAITFQNKKVAYHSEGTGTPIVLLHGFCFDSRMWEEFTPLLSNFQIIRIDLSGFGHSELQKESSIKGMADCVHAVLKHLKIKKCVLIGHSMGGYVSLEFAKKHGELLLGLCLFHSHPLQIPMKKKWGE